MINGSMQIASVDYNITGYNTWFSNLKISILKRNPQLFIVYGINSAIQIVTTIIQNNLSKQFNRILVRDVDNWKNIIGVIIGNEVSNLIYPLISTFVRRLTSAITNPVSKGISISMFEQVIDTNRYFQSSDEHEQGWRSLKTIGSDVLRDITGNIRGFISKIQFAITIYNNNLFKEKKQLLFIIIYASVNILMYIFREGTFTKNEIDKNKEYWSDIHESNVQFTNLRKELSNRIDTGIIIKKLSNIDFTKDDTRAYSHQYVNVIKRVFICGVMSKIMLNKSITYFKHNQYKIQLLRNIAEQLENIGIEYWWSNRTKYIPYLDTTYKFVMNAKKLVNKSFPKRDLPIGVPFTFKNMVIDYETGPTISIPYFQLDTDWYVMDGGNGQGKSSFVNIFAGFLPGNVLTGTVEYVVDGSIIILRDNEIMGSFMQYVSFHNEKKVIRKGEMGLIELILYPYDISELDDAKDFDEIITYASILFAQDTLMVNDDGITNMEQLIDYHSLSNGQRTKIGILHVIAMSIFKSIRFLILDEPENGLSEVDDDDAIESLLKILSLYKQCHMNKNKTVIVISHSQRLIESTLFVHHLRAVDNNIIPMLKPGAY